MSAWHLCAALIAWSLVTLPAHGEDDAVKIGAQVDKAVAATTDEITFTITLTTTDEFKNLAIPEQGNRLEGLRIIDFGASGPDKNEDRWQTKRWYRLKADVSGSYVLPSVTLAYKDGAGNDKTLATSDIFVEIKAPEPAPSGEPNATKPAGLRDIKPSIPAGYDHRVIAAAVGGTLLVLVGGGGLAWWLRRRKRQTFAPPPAPHEVALAALATLQSERGDHKDFHFALSATMRAYCEGLLGFPATDRTVEEIARERSNLGVWSDEVRSQFIQILKRSDLIKFTDSVPTAADSQALLEAAIRLVDETRPKPPEPQPDTASQPAESVI